MLEKKIHFFDFDTRHFICVKGHLENSRSDIYSFLNWIYSLKLDSNLSTNKIFGQGVTTKDLNDIIRGILNDEDTLVDLESFYKLLERGDSLESKIVNTIVSKLLDFFIIDDIRFFSRVEYEDMLERNFNALSQNKIFKMIPYNTAVLSAAKYDPFVKKVEQEVLQESIKAMENKEIPKIYRLANGV